MKDPGATLVLNDLLTHERWVGRLARALVRDDADAAEDIAQEARIAFWRRPPRDPASARPWLGTVVRNLARNRARDRQTRQAALARAEVTETAPPPDAVAERLALHKLLADLVATLDPPFREALVLRYYEGLSAADIARRLDLPAGTVRWRTKKALERLRAMLDERHGGDRGRWIVLVAPFAAKPEPAAAVALPTAKLASVALGGAAVAMLLAVGWRETRDRGREARADAPAGAAVAAGTAGGARSGPGGRRPESPEARARRERSALLGVVLPALAAASKDAEPLTAEQALARCLELKQHALRCNGELADSSTLKLGADVRARLRDEAAAELREEASGRAALREARCRKQVEYKTFTRSEEAEMQGCSKAPDCAAFVACARPFFDKLILRPPVTAERAQEIAARVPPGGLPIAVDDRLLEALNRMVGSEEARQRTQEALGRLREHQATVNEVLAAAKVPPELAAVALLESGFDGAVRSPSGAATGPWQITGKTAQKYGLDVADGRDERLDVRRSTEAAAALLRDLHGQFGSWDLAVAAYHMGPRAVTQAIAAGGTQDIAELEARGLVPPYRSGVMAGAMVIRDPSLLE